MPWSLLILLSVMIGLPTFPVGAESRNSLLIAHAIDALTLDPHQTGMRESRIVTQQVFDYLVYATASGLHPGLASSWEVSPDGKSWTISLVSGAKFHDGAAVTAEAVKFNFERIVKLGPRALTLVNLASSFDRADVSSPGKLRVLLKRPYAPFINMLGEYFAIVSPAAESLGDGFGRHPVGSGPFIFRSWTPNEQIVLARNPAYRWGPAFLSNQGPAQLDQIVYRVIPEASTLTAAFQRGEAQMIDFANPPDVVKMRKLGAKFDTVVQITPGMVISYLFNLRREPTNDLRVRQAVAYAIDREELIRSPAFGPGLIPIAYSLLSQTNWAHSKTLEASRPYAHNLDKARALLDEAGWRPGADGVRVKDGKPLTLLIPSSPLPIFRATDLIVQGQLRKIGIAAEIQAVDTPGYFAAVTRDNFHLALNSAAGFDPDSPMTRTFYSKGGSNFGHYQNATVDQLIESAAVELNAEQRRTGYNRIQETLFRELPAVPLYPFTGIVLKQPGVSGVFFDPRLQYKLINAAAGR